MSESDRKIYYEDIAHISNDANLLDQVWACKTYPVRVAVQLWHENGVSWLNLCVVHDVEALGFLLRNLPDTFTLRVESINTSGGDA